MVVSIEVREDAAPAKINLKLSNVGVNGFRGFGIYAISHAIAAGVSLRADLLWTLHCNLSWLFERESLHFTKRKYYNGAGLPHTDNMVLVKQKIDRQIKHQVLFAGGVKLPILGDKIRNA